MTFATELFGGLFSFGGLIGFLVGVALTIVFYRLEDRYSSRHCPEDGTPKPMHKLRSIWILWAILFVVTGYIGVQEQTTANQVRHLSANTAECQKQFFTALKLRAQVNDKIQKSNNQSDEWSREKTLAISNWLRDILTPPADMLALRERDSADPKYTEWVINITQSYLHKIDILEKAQEAELADRAAHPQPPLPEPTCGR